METLDAEEYMDVITTYRCKFCDFTADRARDIGLHVKAVHITPRTVVLASSDQLSSIHSQETSDNKPYIEAIQNHVSELTVNDKAVCNENDLNVNTDVVLRAVNESNLNIQNEAIIETEVSNSLEALVVSGGNDVNSVMTYYKDEHNGEIVGYVVDGQTYSVVAPGKGHGQPAVGQGHRNNVQVIENDNNTYDLIYSDITTCSTGVNIIDAEVKESNVSNTNVQLLANDEHGQENDRGIENNVTEEVNSDKDIEYIIQEDVTNASTYDTENTDTADPESDIDADCTGNTQYQKNDSNMHIFIENSEDASVRRISIDTLKKALIANNVIPNDIDEAEIEMELTPKNSVPVDNVEDNSVIAPKELYLCGNCSEGFSSIQACKDHMLTDHGQYAEENPAENSLTSDTMPHNKIDACTQVEPKKKPGRKKKSEMRPASPQQELEEDEVISDSGSELDWTERLNVDYSRNNRAKRKRRPPAALRNDYYLGKKGKEKLTIETSMPENEDIETETGEPEETETRYLNWKKSLMFRCTLKGCTAKFRNKDLVKKHLECHIRGAKQSEPAFRCLKCTEQFVFWKQARYHLWKKHREDVGMLSCDVCDTFKTDAPSKLKTHMEVHGSDRPYTCPVCKKGFKQQSQMKNHVIIHKDVLPESEGKWYASAACDICGRMFANSKCLKTHVDIVHSGSKPFKCPHCNHSCSRKAMMQLHMRIHTQEKPFKCDACSFAAKDHNSLRRHKMRHTGYRPYKCPHCPYACIQAISLKVHIKNKHPGAEGVYLCHLCFYKTLNKTLYEDHIRDHKNGLIETLDPPAQMAMKALKSRKQKPVINPQITNISNTLMKQWQGTNQAPSQIITLQATSVDNHNNSQPQIIQLPSNPQVMQVEMQVQTNADGQNVIMEEEFAKLNNFEGLVQSDMAAAQLIFSALNAMSQNTQQTITRKTGAIVAEIGNNEVTNNSTVVHEIADDSIITHNGAITGVIANNGVIVQEVHHTNTPM